MSYRLKPMSLDVRAKQLNGTWLLRGSSYVKSKGYFNMCWQLMVVQPVHSVSPDLFGVYISYHLTLPSNINTLGCCLAIRCLQYGIPGLQRHLTLDLVLNERKTAIRE